MNKRKTTRKPPVFLLAFSNESGSRRLQGLKEERKQIHRALRPLEKEGLCELVIEYDATFDDIKQALIEHGDRLALFHFGGHAGPNELQLEDQDGGADRVDAGGFAALLSARGRRAPSLAFINGCSSEKQAEKLLDFGVLAVIGTGDSIDDNVAAKMATEFYQKLAKDVSLLEAFQWAEDSQTTHLNNEVKQAYSEDSEFAHPKARPKDWPWKLFARPGNEQATQTWTIRGLTSTTTDWSDAELLGYMCDRQDQLETLFDLLPKDAAETPDQPLGLIVHGPTGEAHNKFVHRLQAWDLPRYFQGTDGQPALVQLLQIDWRNSADSMKSALAEKVGLEFDASDEDIRQAIVDSCSPTIIATTITIRDWNRETPSVIKAWLRGFSSMGPLPKGQLLLPIVSIIEEQSWTSRVVFWKTTPTRLVRRIASSDSKHAEALPELRAVPLHAVTDEWLNRDFKVQVRELIEELPVERKQLVLDIRLFVRDLYDQKKQTSLPMEALGDHLTMKIWEATRKGHYQNE